MRGEYIAVDSIQTSDTGEQYLSFGIRAPSGTRIDDITTDFDSFAAFLFRLNYYRASELHFLDIIVDFLP